MAYTIRTTAATGLTLVATLQRRSDSYYWDDATDQAWEAAPSFADKSITLTEGSGDYIGSYTGSPASSVGTEDVDVYIHDTGNSNLVIGQGLVQLVGGDEVIPITPIDPVEVVPELTHFCDGVTSRSVINLNAGFSGTLALKPDIGDATILTVNSAVLSGAASVTGTSLGKDKTQQYAYYKVATLSTTGTYTATVSITTTDSQTIVYTGTITVS